MRKTGKTRKGNCRHPLSVVRSRECRPTNQQRYSQPIPKPRTPQGPQACPVLDTGKAIIAVAHKMIRTIYLLFAPDAKRIATPELITRRSGSESECPARQIQTLKKYGYWPKIDTVNTSIPAPAY